MKLAHYWLVVVAALWAAAAASAQPKPFPTPLGPGTGFSIVGLIQSFRLDDMTKPATAAKITVNGITVVIPGNLQIVMPGRYMTAWQVFVFNPKNPNNLLTDPNNPPDPGVALPTAKDKPDATVRSGLALDDPGVFGSYEVSIQGNVVDAPGAVPPQLEYRAGIVHISQLSLASATGYVNAINPATGDLRVGGVMGDATTGARVRLNDPVGRFGDSTSHDVRFSVDDGNATVRAVTGYPMCVPRKPPNTNAECPSNNRPARAAEPSPVCHLCPGAPARIDFATCALCDATKQTPIQPGDLITYSGVYAKDSAGGVFVSAYSVLVNVAIFTKPGAWPAYVNQEVSLIGTGGDPFPGLPQETGPGKTVLGFVNTRLKVVGFSSDPTRPVNIYRVRRNLCNSSAGWDPTTKAGLEFLAVAPREDFPLGRFRGQIDRRNFQPVPYEILTLIEPPPGKTFAKVANGLIPGTFSAPVGEYLFPENTTAGAPVLPLNFQDFDFLVGGTGASAIAQLDPWPGIGPWPNNNNVSATVGTPPKPRACP